jgi:hypothetical protein
MERTRAPKRPSARLPWVKGDAENEDRLTSLSVRRRRVTGALLRHGGRCSSIASDGVLFWTRHRADAGDARRPRGKVARGCVRNELRAHVSGYARFVADEGVVHVSCMCHDDGADGTQSTTRRCVSRSTTRRFLLVDDAALSLVDGMTLRLPLDDAAVSLGRRHDAPSRSARAVRPRPRRELALPARARERGPPPRARAGARPVRRSRDAGACDAGGGMAASVVRSRATGCA